jgi:hypothetical protein
MNKVAEAHMSGQEGADLIRRRRKDPEMDEVK